MTCRDPLEMVEERIDRVLTQYRESPNLLFMLRTYLGEAANLYNEICSLPEFFQIETAVGDQLTLIGKRLGWPRCHCACITLPVFGFECEGFVSDKILAGFCDPNSTWAGCADEYGVGDICINDDELYRKFLMVRRYQFLALFDRQSLNEAIKIMFGDDARILADGHGRVVIAPGRQLTSSEYSVLQLYPRVLPIAPGIEVRFHFGTNLRVFGFGEGWGGFCEVAANGGAGLPIETESGISIETESGVVIETEVFMLGSPWMCEVDVKPYSC